MRRITVSTTVLLALFSLGALLSALPAKADDILHRITVNVAPVYLFSTNTDANANPPPPPGLTPIGYTRDNPVVDGWRIDYGIGYKISSKFTLAFAHSNVGYELGRILTIAPNTAFVSGSIYDYTDTAALAYDAGHGIGVHATYFSHQRSVVTGLCLNQKQCPDAAGVEQNNPLSIDEVGYTLGATYDFGPTTRVGKLLTAAFDVKYLPRPAGPPSPGAALDGLGHWVGSTFVFPYSLTARLPLTKSSTFVPSVTYINLPVFYHDSAVPEAYRGMIYGFSKVVSQNITVSFNYFNIQTCRCIERVPPPDNLRLMFGILRFDFHTQL